MSNQTNNDGGLAFPFTCQGPTTAPEFYYGMSLRDYFAAAAIQGIVANPGWSGHIPGAVEDAHKIADALLAARAGKLHTTNCPICEKPLIGGPSSETVQTERGPAHRECGWKGVTT